MLPLPVLGVVTPVGGPVGVYPILVPRSRLGVGPTVGRGLLVEVIGRRVRGVVTSSMILRACWRVPVLERVLGGEKMKDRAGVVGRLFLPGTTIMIIILITNYYIAPRSVSTRCSRGFTSSSKIQNLV